MGTPVGISFLGALIVVGLIGSSSGLLVATFYKSTPLVVGRDVLLGILGAYLAIFSLPMARLTDGSSLSGLILGSGLGVALPFAVHVFRR